MNEHERVHEQFMNTERKFCNGHSQSLKASLTHLSLLPLVLLISRLAVHDRLLEVILGEVVVLVVLAHELHERPAHAQDDEHLELLVGEQRVALRQHVPRAAQRALAEGLGVQRTDLAERGRGHDA